MSTINQIDILEPHQNRIKPFFNDKFNPLACASVGFVTACFKNWVLRRPIFSGVQSHILFTVAGAGLGVVVDKRRDDYLAERDAVLRHYIELHPDDFPPIERKKYGETLEQWAPIR